jgi:hypothetical protein
VNGGRTKLWQRRLRTALVLIAVAAACYVSYGFGRLWAEWRQTTQQLSPRQAVPESFRAMAAVMPLAGQWSFAELDWNLRSTLLAPEDVAPRLNALAKAAIAYDTSKLPEVSDELVALAKSLHVEPIVNGKDQIYSLDRNDLKAHLVVRVADGLTKVVALAAAYPYGDDEWQLLECTPRATSSSATAAAAHMLPIPEPAERNGGRYADDGRLLLELITLQSNAETLTKTWKEAGWEVRPSGMGSPDGFSYLCARGGEVIYAWSADPPSVVQNLMLVRTPTASDTRP